MSHHSRSLEEHLSCHPELHQKIEQLLKVVESTGDDLACADEAERQVIETLRQMGHDALSAWANRRMSQASVQSAADPALRPGSAYHGVARTPCTGSQILEKPGLLMVGTAQY